MLNRALKIVREVHRMKQGELADSLGISKSYLSELERGEKKVSLDVLNKYASTFDVPASTFLSFMEALEGQSEARRARAEKLLSVLAWTVENEHSEDEESAATKKAN
ncbi:helix-turn-helix domain-containing protein [Pseudoxanthomonas sp. UC19_8]|uniref:helix-turn-helix domain-containing protein n=1 Tax=Pseudoxanthomonas sp. UC19_8 TaxID=3350175 RepID=UPI0036D2A4A6